jgi:hypothetical protein
MRQSGTALILAALGLQPSGVRTCQRRGDSRLTPSTITFSKTSIGRSTRLPTCTARKRPHET